MAFLASNLIRLCFGLLLIALAAASGCRWAGSCESEFTVHQPTASAGLQPQGNQS